MTEPYDYYAILGLDERATDDEVREAYRRAARANHPDLNPHDPHAAQRFAIVTRAYEVLADPVRRAAYRRRATPARHGSTAVPGSDTSVSAAGPAAPSLATELGLAVGALRVMARRAHLDRRVKRRVRQVIRYLERL